jgi:hypothetical protein
MHSRSCSRPFLAGISIGSYIAAPLTRWTHRSLVPLAVAELAVAIAALLSVYFLAQTYDVADGIGRFVGSASGTNLRFMLLASAVAILPTTILMGLDFPIGLYVFAGKSDGGNPRRAEASERSMPATSPAASSDRCSPVSCWWPGSAPAAA